MPKILVVEDDIDLSNLIQTVLESKGHEVFTALNGKIALETLDITNIDLIISDIMMPQLDGFLLLSDIRQANMKMPVLLVTAKGSYDDKNKGFSSGADDYMVKPIDIKELVLRVNALLRRSKIANERQLRVADVTLDADTLRVIKGEDAYTLAPNEFYLLFKLLSYPNRVFTRFEIMSEVWGYDSESDEKTINVHISKLRSKFESWPEFEIVTIRGLGYKAIVKDDQYVGK